MYVMCLLSVAMSVGPFRITGLCVVAACNGKVIDMDTTNTHITHAHRRQTALCAEELP